MKLLFLIYHRLDHYRVPDWFLDRLRADFPTVTPVRRSNYENVEQEIADAEVVVTWSLRPEQFNAARKLRWIHSPAAGVNQLMIPEIINSNVVITNSSEVHGPVVAEHTLGLMFALAKRIPSAVRWQMKHTWAQDKMWNEFPKPRELGGATLGLIGLGSIGWRVAEKASGLGMRVLAVRAHPERGLGFVPLHQPATGTPPHAVFAPGQIDDVLSQSDYVVLAAPVTAGTTHLINAERLSKMKRDAYLINVSRGALVDEGALIVALQQHQIGGAALDVFDHEPLPPESPLWDVENLLITPHNAGLSERMWERHYALLSDNLRRYLAGKPLLAVVDKTKGY